MDIAARFLIGPIRVSAAPVSLIFATLIVLAVALGVLAFAFLMQPAAPEPVMLAPLRWSS